MKSDLFQVNLQAILSQFIADLARKPNLIVEAHCQLTLSLSTALLLSENVFKLNIICF